MTFVVMMVFPLLCDAENTSAQTSASSNFKLWQLPSQTNTIGNSYVFQMENGKVVVMDGGFKTETPYLRGFLGALGNEVEAWFISHPHTDHMEALNEILKEPRGIKIKTNYHSRFSKEFYENNEVSEKAHTAEFYANLDQSKIDVVDIVEPGLTIEIDKTKFKILGVKNEEITVNPYNNSSMIIRVDDGTRSVVFLGDAGAEQGDKLLAGPYRDELNCDFLQMAHHGNHGVRFDFYRTIRFSACLWPTPSWVYDNDAGEGFDTHSFDSVKLRKLMEESGITKHFVSFHGLQVIEY